VNVIWRVRARDGGKDCVDYVFHGLSVHFSLSPFRFFLTLMMVSPMVNSYSSTVRGPFSRTWMVSGLNLSRKSQPQAKVPLL